MRHLLITGGTGSFGARMLSALAKRNDFTKISILSRDEKKQEELRSRFPNVRTILGDTRCLETMRLATKGITHVFHAAALKQVPNCESHPWQAILTNVAGTRNVLLAAGEAGVERVIVLSTDKACYPINVMGMTKALAEKLTLAANDEFPDTAFVCTRYGNVLRSRGSVVPLWESQAARGEPLMLTNPRMTRFLMTLDDACDLVLRAFESTERRCIYVLKSPAAYMEDVAHAISPNFVVGKIRPGEKLDETLITSEEMRRTVDCSDHFRITDSHQAGAIHPFTSATTRLLSRVEIRAILDLAVRE
jgi:UDP-glucose 4-epimerase